MSSAPWSWHAIADAALFLLALAGCAGIKLKVTASRESKGWLKKLAAHVQSTTVTHNTAVSREAELLGDT